MQCPAPLDRLRTAFAAAVSARTSSIRAVPGSSTSYKGPTQVPSETKPPAARAALHAVAGCRNAILGDDAPHSDHAEVIEAGTAGPRVAMLDLADLRGRIRHRSLTRQTNYAAPQPVSGAPRPTPP